MSSNKRVQQRILKVILMGLSLGVMGGSVLAMGATVATTESKTAKQPSQASSESSKATSWNGNFPFNGKMVNADVELAKLTQLTSSKRQDDKQEMVKTPKNAGTILKNAIDENQRQIMMEGQQQLETTRTLPDEPRFLKVPSLDFGTISLSKAKKGGEISLSDSGKQNSILEVESSPKYTWSVSVRFGNIIGPGSVYGGQLVLTAKNVDSGVDHVHLNPGPNWNMQIWKQNGTDSGGKSIFTTSLADAKITINNINSVGKYEATLNYTLNNVPSS